MAVLVAVRKFWATLAVALGVIGGFTVAAPASAATNGSHPTNCSYGIDSGGKRSYAVCYGGGGMYRAVAICKPNGLGWDVDGIEYGPWVALGKVSYTPNCGFGVKSAGMTTRK